MIGIGYFKAEPTEYARVTAGGKVKKEGKGISRFYLKHSTSLELISVTRVDFPFVFTETTSDKQALTLQGGIVYQVSDPAKVLALYNHSVDPKTHHHLTDDPGKLPEHILEAARANARHVVQKRKLEDLLTASDELSQNVQEKLAGSKVIQDLGVELSGVYFSSVQSQPEIAKALGATYRESLLQKADEASYQRRAKAVEQEKAIGENELSNKIDLERKREQLVELQGKNTMKEARYQADAASMQLEVYKSMDADLLRAHALLQLGRDAKRIESLSVTPELLGALNSRV